MSDTRTNEDIVAVSLADSLHTGELAGAHTRVVAALNAAGRLRNPENLAGYADTPSLCVELVKGQRVQMRRDSGKARERIGTVSRAGTDRHGEGWVEMESGSVYNTRNGWRPHVENTDVTGEQS